ncbi:hypothetical protein HD554DRAFT_2178456 [Boletus coccyginus]|nr:hypothetical protein HD554DRAFT_2178456 [Boletus coccyginus]
MSTSTLSLFCNILAIIEAAISLSAFLIHIFRSHLPRNKIKELEHLMDEMETFFTKTVEKGLLAEPDIIQTRRELSMLRTQTLDLKSRVYSITTFREDCLELLGGTSSYIGETCECLQKLRAKVVASSEKECRRLMEDDRDLRTSSLPVLPYNPAPECQDSPLPSVQIPRPAVHPPILPGRKSLYAQRTFHPTNPPSNLARGDPDVRIVDTQECVSIIHTSVTLEPSA